MHQHFHFQISSDTYVKQTATDIIKYSVGMRKLGFGI